MSNRSPSHTEIEVVKNQYSDRDYLVKISIPEFTCVCPRTGQPDFANIIIDYVPKLYLIESKSFKIFIQSFRSFGIFHEDALASVPDSFDNKEEYHNVNVNGTENILKLANEYGIEKVFSSMEEAFDNKESIFDLALPPANLLDVVEIKMILSFASTFECFA